MDTARTSGRAVRRSSRSESQFPIGGAISTRSRNRPATGLTTYFYRSRQNNDRTRFDLKTWQRQHP